MAQQHYDRARPCVYGMAAKVSGGGKAEETAGGWTGGGGYCS